jgi:hypothetical protein
MGDMLGRRRGSEGARRWTVGLVLLAFLLQALTPAGFMLTREGGQATVAICTGHGAAHSLADLAGDPAKAPKSRPDSPCAPAGHKIGVAPPLLALIASPIALPAVAPQVGAQQDLAPGRGLAAPPPPSQGPPTLTL